jgi:galactose mutarotase-like enzyme
VLEAVSGDGTTVAQFVPAAGMVCCSLRHRGVEHLDARQGLDAYVEHGSTMGIPLLYPWANRLADYGYEVAGERVELPRDPARIHADPNGLPIHGVHPTLLHWLGSVRDDGSVAAELQWTGAELLELFPFPHELELEALAEPGALTITTTVRAVAGDPVPVSFGFHPYLLLPGGNRATWSLELPPGEHLRLDARLLPTGDSDPIETEPLSLADHEFDDAYRLRDCPARFVAASASSRIVVELIEGYSFAQAYSPAGSAFVCFEPMTAPGNALRSGDGLRVLAPGEEHRAVFRVDVA